jgi:Restriction endonuclease S subunits
MVKVEGMVDGYWNSEVGIIPDTWEVDTIKDSYEICNNLRFPISNDVRSKMKGKYPYYGPTKIQDYINEYRLEGKYALIGEDGDHFLKWATNPMTILAEGKFNVNNHAHVVKGKVGLTEWFYIYFCHRDITQVLSRQGAGRYKLNKATLEKLLIALPPIEEQKAIATALSDMNDLILSIEKLISKKKLIKEGAMQELLTGNRRITGFSSEWITKKLGDLGEFSGAGIDKKINKNEENVRLLNYLDVYRKDFIYSKDLWHIVTAPKYKLQQCSIQRGDIFFTPSSEMREDIALSSLAVEDINDAGYSYHVVRFRFKENWDTLFKAYIFKTKAFLDQAEMFCEGSGKRYVISLRKFREFEVKYPVDINEQEAIGNILYSMSMEIEKLEKKLGKYKNIKSGMMEELLTGKRRLV